MKKTIEVSVLAVVLMVGAALFVNAQVGLWVSNASGLTTGGKVAVTSSASDALSVTGGIQTTGSITSPRNVNSVAQHVLSNTNSGSGSAVQLLLENNSGAVVGLVLGSSAFTGLENKARLFNFLGGGIEFLLANGGTYSFGGGLINSNASQPGFLAYNSVDDGGLSGTVTVDFDTEVYDQTSSFSADTFTAPVTGTYVLCGSVKHDDIFSDVIVTLKTSNRDYEIGINTSALARFAIDKCVPADMDAADTAFVQVVYGGSPNLIEGGSSPIVTHFSGRLMP